MPGLRDFLSPRAMLLAQQCRIKELETQVAELQAQNDSMRQGMRRCLTCSYREEFKLRQGGNGPAAIDEQTD